MAWIEIHQELFTHRKVYVLSGLLNVNENETVGLLARFWCWALDNALWGNLGRLQPGVIGKAAGWTDGNGFCDAMLKAGFIDVDGETGLAVIHDWMQYGGRLQQKREIDKLRKQAERDRKRKELERLKEVHRTSDGNPPEFAGTVHYSTVHNNITAAVAPPSKNGETEHVPAAAAADFVDIETPLGYYLAVFGEVNAHQRRQLDRLTADYSHEVAMRALRWAADGNKPNTSAILTAAATIKREGIDKRPLKLKQEPQGDYLPYLGRNPDKGVL